MTDLLLTSFVSNDGQTRAAELTAAQGALKQMVLDSVTSPHTRRNYAKLWIICSCSPRVGL